MWELSVGEESISEAWAKAARERPDWEEALLKTYLRLDRVQFDTTVLQLIAIGAIPEDVRVVALAKKRLGVDK